MKGQSFPLVPRDKRSFTVTTVLPNCLSHIECECVCFALTTFVCAHVGKRVSPRFRSDDRDRDNIEAEKDRETLKCTVRVFMEQQRMRFFYFSFKRGHTDRDYLLIVKEQKQDKFQLQYHIHPVLSWSGPMERFSLGFGVAQIDPHTS